MYVADVLHGRDDERARLASLVDTVGAGRAGVLVLEGDPGVGKSALLDDLVSTLTDAGAPVRVLSTTGVAAEAPLPFAALLRLLRPVLDWDRLPAPQARALRVAFGVEDGSATPVQPFLVGLATLSVLTGAAEDAPVVCIVDDAHWLDTASADALLFTARQLQADPVALVFATRPDSGFDPEGLPLLHLDGLGAEAARRLLADHTTHPTPPDVTERLLAETGGNPLALIELPTRLSDDQLGGTGALPPRLPLTARVERAFLDRVRRAGEDVQTLLLVLAADDTGRAAVVRRAAEQLGAGAPAWVEAERSGLVVVAGDAVRVRHPLVRSAVHQSATSLERRGAHAALAEALGDDPDRRTWHRAMATDAPDPGVADAVHAVAERTERRGAHPAAADAFERAADLTPTGPRRAERLYAAARNAWSAGDTTRSAALCAAARALADDPVLRADVDRLRGRIEVNVGSAVDAHRIFALAAERVAAHDPVRALELAVAVEVARSHGIDSGARIPEHLVPVDAAPGDSGRTRVLKQVLTSTRLDVAGDRGAALAELHRALGTALDAADARADLDLLGNLGNAALHLGDDEAHHRFYSLMLTGARADGDGMRVLYALQRLPFSQYVTGDWAALRASCEEAVTLATSVGQPSSTAGPRVWLALLAALQGQSDVDERVAGVEELVASHPPVGILAQPVADLLRWAKGVHALTTGSAADALHHLGAMRLPALTHLAATDRLDAAARAGDLALVAAWVAELDEAAAGTDLPWARAAAELGRALASGPDDDADGWFSASLAHHAQADRPYDRARVQLAYGEHLRRGGRRVDARTHLRAALRTFEDLRAAPSADRAGRELRASGETARKRDPSTALDLTPMELKVAQLVSQGLSNKDVAAQCWVSPRTVAFHLRNVFTKLGVASRGELAQLDLT